MSCDAVLKLIPLYFYGELKPDQEEDVEQHLHECAACARELEHQRNLAALLDGAQPEVPASLLLDCRTELAAAVQFAGPIARPAGPWRRLLEGLSAMTAGLGRFRQPVGALALMAVGFFAANYINRPAAPVSPASPLAEDVFNTVRSVEPDASGGVRIAFDETRRRTVSGSLDDQQIQNLLLAAVHDQNPEVRVHSMGLLKDHADAGGVRAALLNAVAHDPNTGVRMQALEGLKPLAADADVLKTLSQVLVGDDNPAIRMQVVDVLAQSPDQSIIGVLQGVVQKEDNGYVRLKCEKALKEMNASVGTF